MGGFHPHRRALLRLSIAGRVRQSKVFITQISSSNNEKRRPPGNCAIRARHRTSSCIPGWDADPPGAVMVFGLAVRHSPRIGPKSDGMISGIPSIRKRKRGEDTTARIAAARAPAMA